MLVKACQCSPMDCGIILLMQLSSTFFFHGNALTNVSLACGHQAGKHFVMEPETWPDYRFCNKTPKFTWTFQLVGLAGESLGFLDGRFWLSGAQDLVSCRPSLTFWAALSSPFFRCDRQSLFLHKTLDRMQSLWEASKWEQLVSANQATTSSAHWLLPDWFYLDHNDSLAFPGECTCDNGGYTTLLIEPHTTVMRMELVLGVCSTE